MRRAVLTAGLIWGLWTGWPVSAAAEAWLRDAFPSSGAIQTLGQMSAPVMKLGLRSDRRPAPEPLMPQSGVRPGHKPDQCQKWRAMAHHLGETFAGHALRESVLKRICLGLAGERADDVWDWPWAGFADGRLLPPRTHRTMGAWQIRCGAAAKRKRCALLHLAEMPEGAVRENASPIIAHVVIDMVAGRESVLWRVFVPQQDAQIRGAHLGSQTDAPSPVVVPARERPVLTYQIGTYELADRFSTCAPAGCMMEANLRHAGVVVSGMWDGVPVDFRIPDSGGTPQVVRVPARGFRAGLAELMRLRREELRHEKR